MLSTRRAAAVLLTIDFLNAGTADATRDQVAVSRATATGYRLEATSGSGTTFTAEKRSSGITRTCGAGCTW